MHRTLLICLLAAVCAPSIVGCGNPAACETEPRPIAAAAPSADSLYKRLGGYDALAAVTDDFLDRLQKDPKESRFFQGLSTDSLHRVRQLIVDQLCHATGGPCFYVGREMRTAHAGLGITEDDWTLSVSHLVATLDKFKVPQREKDEVLALLTTLKPDIVVK